jgi:hypothetical protein
LCWRLALRDARQIIRSCHAGHQRRPRRAVPVLPVFDEIQSRIADKLPGVFVDPSLNGNPVKVAGAVKNSRASPTTS